MPKITRGNSAKGKNTASTSLGITHTISSSDNRVLLAFLATSSVPEDYPSEVSATYASQSMTFLYEASTLDEIDSEALTLQVFMLKNPPVGSATCTISWTGTMDCAGLITVDYAFVNQNKLRPAIETYSGEYYSDGPIDEFAVIDDPAEAWTSPYSSLTIQTYYRRVMVVDCMFNRGATGVALTAGADQTLIETQAINGASGNRMGVSERMLASEGTYDNAWGDLDVSPDTGREICWWAACLIPQEKRNNVC